jgi:hypothetical protein
MESDRTILAILQNQWFRPESVNKVNALYALVNTPEERATLNARFLFGGCKSGKIIQSVYGYLYSKIIWENANSARGTFSASVYDPDVEHISSIILHFKPEVVLTFGRHAQKGVEEAVKGFGQFDPDFLHLYSVHPAARGAGVADQFRKTALCLVDYLSK